MCGRVESCYISSANLLLSKGGAYNIGYDEKLRANRQFLTSVDSELRLTLRSMELVGWNLTFVELRCIENAIQVL
jgi:hypothetical protein